MLCRAHTLGRTPPLNNTSVQNSPASNGSVLFSAATYSHHVPGTSIVVVITTTKATHHDWLTETLLRIWDFTDLHIRTHGDSILGPSEDPFHWLPSGPPGGNPLSFQAVSSPGKHMTWSVLAIAATGLSQAMPTLNHDYCFDFIIWDIHDQALWGCGWLKESNLSQDTVAQDVTGNGQCDLTQLDQKAMSRKRRALRQTKSEAQT